MPSRAKSYRPASATDPKEARRTYQRFRTDKKEQAFYRSARWRKLRVWFLNRNPICNRCQASAEEVHHIVELKADPERALDPDNLEALCKRCHSRETGKKPKPDGRVQRRSP